MIQNTEKMHRWSKDHPLPVHVTEGNLSAFMLISPTRPPYVKPTKAVSVSVEEYDRQWKLIFRLNSTRYYPMFKAFYDDVFESTWNVNIEDAAEKFLEIYKKWKHAFSTDGTPLSKEEVQGLIGEMCVIDEILLKKYDPKTILNAWMITQKGKQDFIFSDTWYEVKSTHIGSNTVTITSAEQLDCSTVGFLSVVKLKTTSINDEKRVSLGILIKRLQNVFDEQGCGEEFLAKLEELDLPNEEYENQVYEIVELDQYEVKDGFPYLRRSTLSPAIGLVQYELYLEQLKLYKV